MKGDWLNRAISRMAETEWLVYRNLFPYSTGSRRALEEKHEVICPRTRFLVKIRLSLDIEEIKRSKIRVL
jgi:hypothetical protein